MANEEGRMTSQESNVVEDLPLKDLEALLLGVE